MGRARCASLGDCYDQRASASMTKYGRPGYLNSRNVLSSAPET